jgi:hypothetical protein
MRKPGAKVPVYSENGSCLRYIRRQEALSLIYDPQSGFVPFRDGIQTYRSKLVAKNETPCCITAAEVKLNAGLCGEPHKEIINPTTGDVDVIFASRLKISVWHEIGNVIAESTHAFCPWPNEESNFNKSAAVEGLTLAHPIASEVRDSLLTQLKLRPAFA